MDKEDIVTGVIGREDGLFIQVFGEGKDHAELAWVPHEMQLLLVQKILNHLSSKARQLEWMKTGGPVPENMMK